MNKIRYKRRRSSVVFTFLLFIIITLLFNLIQSNNCYAAKKVRLGVLFDTKNEDNKSFIDQLRQETTSLLGTKYDIAIPDNKIVSASWSRQRILEKYKKLVDDDEVDIIIAIGGLNCAILSQLKTYPKPLILLGILDSALQQTRLTKDKKSGIKNLTYILFAMDFESDLDDFFEIFPYKSIAVVIDKKLAALIPGVDQTFKKFFAEKNVKGYIVAYDGNVDDVIKSFPTKAEAVLFGGLFRMPIIDRKKLIDHVNGLKLPSYAFQGEVDVKLGVLAGTAPETHLQKIARRFALNIEKILAGLDPADFPTLLSFEKRLIINMETARKIDFSPNWSTLAQAELINERVTHSKQVLDFGKIVQLALSKNLSLNIEKQTVQSAVEDVSKARSDLFPSLSASATEVKIDEDSAGALQAEETRSGKLTVDQVIYADQLWANLTVQKHLLSAAEAKQHTVILDTVLNAGVYYLDILRSKTNENILRNNLKLVRRNYEIAEYRQRVGYSGKADVYRWKSELATATSDLLAAQSNLRAAKISLNEFLYRPLNEKFIVKDIGLSEKLFERYGYNEIRGIVDNPKSLDLMTEFLVLEAKNNLPEIKQLKEDLAAQERILKANKRKRFLPVISFQSQAGRVFSRNGTGADLFEDNDSSWNASLNASWELFSGGGISADTRQALSEKIKLQTQLKDTTRKIELNLRNAILDLRVKSADIRLSKDAAEAAGKNYELVKDAYSKGTTSIVTLLDARNAALAANQSAANSVYEYYISLLTVERAFGNFTVITPIDEQKAFYNRFKNFMLDRSNKQSN